jgi:hypothetical protein
VAQIAYSEAWRLWQPNFTPHFTTKELLDEVSSYGISAVRLTLAVPYWDGIRKRPAYPLEVYLEDMHEVWGHPGIDVFVILFADHADAIREVGCTGKKSVNWPAEPTEEIARFLLDHFGEEDKTIIFATPEIDNQWRGFDCTTPDVINFSTFWGPQRLAECLAAKTQEECVYEMAMIRYDYAIQRVEERARVLAEVRRDYPYARLRLASSMTVSVTMAQDKYFGHYALQRVADMVYKPLYLGLSHWGGHGRTIGEAIQHIRDITGYPEWRIFVDQIGQNEKVYGLQYDLLTDKTTAARSEGINLVLVWLWKQTWHKFKPSGKPENKGMWSWESESGPVVFGAPNSGLDAIIHLNGGS